MDSKTQKVCQGDRVYFVHRSYGRDVAEVVGLDGDDLFLRRTDRRINNGYVVVKAATCERIVLHEAKFVQNEPLNIGKVIMTSEMKYLAGPSHHDLVRQLSREEVE